MDIQEGLNVPDVMLYAFIHLEGRLEQGRPSRLVVQETDKRGRPKRGILKSFQLAFALY